MHKDYLVTYKDGKTQMVNGKIVLFSSSYHTVPMPNCGVYLNADEVLSIVEQSETKEKENQ